VGPNSITDVHIRRKKKKKGRNGNTEGRQRQKLELGCHLRQGTPRMASNCQKLLEVRRVFLRVFTGSM
jgi:hypothetical protein